MSFRDLSEQGTIGQLAHYLKTLLKQPLAIFRQILEGLQALQLVRNVLAHANGSLIDQHNDRLLQGNSTRLCEQLAQDATAIRRAAGRCLKKAPLDRPIRLLGVRADRLVRANEVREERDSSRKKPKDGQLTLPLP